MVNLLDMYESHGFQVNVQELPDYIPLFLEFLAQIPQAEAQQLLQDALPILALLGARLTERNSAYAAIFDALLDLAGAPELLAESCEQIALKAKMTLWSIWMPSGKRKWSVLWGREQQRVNRKAQPPVPSLLCRVINCCLNRSNFDQPILPLIKEVCCELSQHFIIWLLSLHRDQRVFDWQLGTL